MSNKKLEMRIGVKDTSGVIGRRFNYLGHLWKSSNEVGKEDVKWTPC